MPTRFILYQLVPYGRYAEDVLFCGVFFVFFSDLFEFGLCDAFKYLLITKLIKGVKQCGNLKEMRYLGKAALVYPG